MLHIDIDRPLVSSGKSSVPEISTWSFFDEGGRRRLMRQGVAVVMVLIFIISFGYIFLVKPHDKMLDKQFGNKKPAPVEVIRH